MSSAILNCVLIFSTLDKKSKATKYLSHANDTSEWLSKFYIKYSVFALAVSVVLIPMSVLICFIRKGHFDADYAIHASRVVSVIVLQCFEIHYFVSENKFFPSNCHLQCAVERKDPMRLFRRTNGYHILWWRSFGWIWCCFITFCVDMPTSPGVFGNIRTFN